MFFTLYSTLLSLYLLLYLAHKNFSMIAQDIFLIVFFIITFLRHPKFINYIFHWKTPIILVALQYLGILNILQSKKQL